MKHLRLATGVAGFMLATVLMTLGTDRTLADTSFVQQKLYVLHSLGEHVSVVDVSSNELLGEIKVGRLPHGIASPASQRLLYVSNEGDNSLSVIDTQTDRVIKHF